MSSGPRWALGGPVPMHPREWEEFGKRLEEFVVGVLCVRKNAFADALGVTPTTAARWFKGSRMDVPLRNVLGHLAKLAEDVPGPKALELCAKRREQYAAEAVDPEAGLPESWNEADDRIDLVNERLARLEADLRELRARMTALVATTA